MTSRHKVFVSYHHENDQAYRQQFERVFSNVIVSRSVDIGDINLNLNTEYVRQIIRDEYLSDSSVTVVLVGAQTWQRKHVDWEVSSSIRDTQKSPRSGLLGILLPTYPFLKPNTYSWSTIPPRLHDNVECGYAKMRLWTTDQNKMKEWIDEAFRTKDHVLPNNSRPMFGKNHTGTGWQ
ncbi:MAG: TIR domain-containing protein [Thermoplasmata archaeon]|nr:TIR domain-containing protein [Thermoplasmata archaeon]